MTIDELIAVLEAVKAGEPIQCRHGKNWIAGGTDIRFMCEAIGKGFEYRPKPKPLEFFRNEYFDGTERWLGAIHETRAEADSYRSDETIACHRFVQDMDYLG